MTKSILLSAFTVVSVFMVYQTATAQMEAISDQRSMIKALEWQEAHPIYASSPTDWTNGAYYTGLVQAHKSTDDAIYLAALKNMGWKNNWQTASRPYHADDVAISYAYLYLNNVKKNLVDLQPTEKFLEEHLFEPNQWKGGSDSVKSILWWWCDALFMAPPVIVQYASLKKDDKYLQAMHKYYQETYDLLFNDEERLFARDTRYVWTGNSTDLKEENGKKIFWSRGNGWVIGGLALMLEDLPESYEQRDFYLKLYKQMANRIKGLQSADGLWRTSLLSPDSYDHGEVSGSGFFTFALAWGINNGILDKAEYTPIVRKAWTALRGCQQEDGRVGWVQNIGASPEPASADSWQNFGTGAFLMAGSEILKLDK